MKKIIFLLITATLAACSRFDEYNTNPDSTTKVTSQMLATYVELQTFKYGADGKAYISLNALPKYVAYLTEGAMDAQYNKIGSCGFNSYTLWPNYTKMIEYSAGTDMESSYRGLASFLKAYNAYNLTMQTGDIPYSEAGNAEEGNTKPKYDSQEYVFEQILQELASAESAFASGKQFTGDIMLDGDPAKWRRVSNAMRLKVLMSLSKKITSEQKAEFKSIVEANNLMIDNSDNLQLVYTSAQGTWHPLYNQTLFAPYTTLSEHVVNEFKRLEDRRLFYFGEPAEAKIKSGLSDNDFNAYVGTNTAVDFITSQTKFQNGEFSIINNRYITEQAGDPYILLTYAEQCFIIAEAIELGWITGNSEKYYNNGVKAALHMVSDFDKNQKYCHNMPIDDNYIESYLSGNAAYASDVNERLKQIWMQKYLLKFLQNGNDTYFEYRRTGYPILPNDPNTSLNIDNKEGFPTRWSYPSIETKTNYENLNQALQRQFHNGYDGTNELMWILK